MVGPLASPALLLSSLDPVRLSADLQLDSRICAAFQRAVVAVLPEATGAVTQSVAPRLMLSVVDPRTAHMFTLMNDNGTACASGHGFPSTGGSYPLFFNVAVAETVTPGVAQNLSRYDLVPFADFEITVHNGVKPSLLAPPASAFAQQSLPQLKAPSPGVPPRRRKWLRGLLGR